MTWEADYDDQLRLAYYLWTWFSKLRTPFEQQVAQAIFARQKIDAAKRSTSSVGESIQKRFAELLEDPDVSSALEEGHEAFIRKTAQRMLTEQRGELLINRCPACAKIVRTPTAKQCLWCGHGWHDSKQKR